jgi:glycosyltransferase involved in cell wall biosynthesis
MKEKKILYIVKGALHIYPPCLTQIFLLKDQGVDITVICGECSPNVVRLLKERNINCIEVGNHRIKPRFLGKVSSYIIFRTKVGKLIRELKDDNTTIWFGTVDGAIALIGGYQNTPYILSVLELYDKNPLYRNGLKQIVHEASAIVSCEENRARIMKSWWGLKKIPYIMPNKPYNHPYNKNQDPSSFEVATAISKIQDKKVIIYQGMIAADRNLSTLAEALNKMESEYTLVLIGSTHYDGVSQIKKIYKNTLYLGYYPAPLHLEITSYAHIGIANYDDSSLNNLFCAPNKIYEYAGFGIPILGSDVPGLKGTIGKYCAGECINFLDKDLIVEAINKIEIDYNKYSTNAKKFYESTNNALTIKKILENI